MKDVLEPFSDIGAPATDFWCDCFEGSARHCDEHKAALVAEVRRLRENQWPEWSQMLTNQSCENGKHADWFVDSEHNHHCPWCERDAAVAEVGRVREALQAANADWETRVEYGRKIGDGWVHEHRGIKYASHQRTVHFRVDEAVLIDHWTYTDHRHPVEGCTHDRHDLTTQGALNAALDSAE